MSGGASPYTSITQAMNQPQKSRISLWPRTAKESGDRFHVGTIELTSELMSELITLHQAGQAIKLDISLFKNNSDNPKAPSRTGIVKLPDFEHQQAPKWQPVPNAQSNPSEDGDEVPF